MVKATELGPVSNDAAEDIASGQPYTALATVVGTAPILFHRWSVEGVKRKAEEKKGSMAKRTDNVESYVYRLEDDTLAIPTEYFRMSIITAAKFRQDPRSPRKSAMDLFKAAIATGEEFCPLGVKDWDYLDQRRVMVQRNGITRTRPAMRAGWKTDMLLQVLLPEYVSLELLNEVLQNAGRLIGVGDFRPSYGRFQVVGIAKVE